MFQVIAKNLKDYLDFDPLRRRDLVEFDQVMKAFAPSLQRHFHAGTPAGEPGMRMTMIGYGRFHYAATSGTSVAWPVIGLALQKNYISVYVSVTKAGAPLVKDYAARLGALRSGHNNFSFRQLADLDRRVLEALVSEAAAIFADDPGNPVRYWTGKP